MLKGIQRQIIEITDTKSPYFERAFLVVSPDCDREAEQRLPVLAQKVVEQGTPYGGLKKQRRFGWLLRSLLSLGAGGLGAFIMWLLLRG